MATRQIFCQHVVASGQSTSTCHCSIVPLEFMTSAASAPWRVAGTFKNFKWVHDGAPGSGKSWTYTLVKNGSDTSAVVTITDLATSGQDISHNVTVAVGDLLYWRRDSSGSPTGNATQYTAQFDGTTTGESGHTSIDDGVTASTQYIGIFSPFVFRSDADFKSIVAAAGTLTDLAYRLNTAPGAGTSRTFTLIKNGTAQDGSGGTPNTVVTISDANTTGLWTGTLALVAGDFVQVQMTVSGAPATSPIGFGCKFVATTDGESNVGGVDNIQNSASTLYRAPSTAFDQPTESTTETNIDVIGGAVESFVLRDFRIALVGTAGSGAGGHTLTTRKNAGNTSQTVTMTGGTTSGSDLTNEVTIDAGDTWSLQHVNIPTAFSRDGSWGWVQFAEAASEKQGCFVAGVTTTVAATRAAAFGLDGNTNTHDEAGKLKVFGDFEVTGTTTFSIESLVSVFSRLLVSEDGELILDEDGNPLFSEE